MSRRPLTVLAAIAVLVGMGVAAYALGPEDPTAPAAATSASNGSVAGEVVRPARGAEDAPVVIAEYSDYLCPFCRRYSLEIAPELQPYVDAGQIRFVWHDFPARGEPSLDAAIAARAAGRQDAYWEFHDVLFERQEELRHRREELVAIAEELGLDVGRFEADLDDPALEAAVLSDLADGQRIGVRGTPSFLIGDRPVVGAQPVGVFVEAIEAELAEAADGS